jgi:hypothetical protein
MRTFAAVVVSILVLCSYDPVVGAQRCGATERWAVKTGTDPDASKVDKEHIRPISVTELNQLPNLRDHVPANDNTTRLGEEQVVYQVSGRLVLFKAEGDTDYHLVITDDTLKFTPGGSGTTGQETGTSFIAEIPDPKCYAGKNGDPAVKSEFEEQLRDTRITFESRFPNGQGADTDLGGIPVTLVGVAFYDRQHNQTGRAVNGIELHPLFSIEFNDQRVAAQRRAALTARAPASPVVALFKEGGSWSANNPALRDGKAADDDDDDDQDDDSIRMGGYGRPHVDSIWQTVRIDKAHSKATLSFVLRIQTDNRSASPSRDTLVVQARTASGKTLKTLAQFSNADAAMRSRPVNLDVRKFRGQTIRLQLTSKENASKATKFSIGDAHIEYR